jgi:hypothetical protein
MHNNRRTRMPTATHHSHNANSPRRASLSLSNGVPSPARQPLTTPTHPAHPPLPPMPTEYSSEPPSLGRVRGSESQTTQILRATEPQSLRDTENRSLRVSEIPHKKNDGTTHVAPSLILSLNYYFQSRRLLQTTRPATNTPSSAPGTPR